MSLLYRAIWSETGSHVPDSAIQTMRSWINDKTLGALSVPDAGRTAVRVTYPARRSTLQPDVVDTEVRVERATGTGEVTEALTATFIESRANETRWDTTLRSWTCSGERQTGWMWVDIEVVGPVELTHLAVAAPRFVVELIKTGTEPSRAEIALSAAPRFVQGVDAAEALAEDISSFDRDIPLVVFSDEPERARQLLPETHTFEDIIQRAAAQIAGLGVVVAADRRACETLTDALGEAHGLWGGAFRMYLPDLDPAIAGDGWRHRYVTADRYMRYRDIAAKTISRSLAPASGTRRPPTSYSAAKDLLSHRRRESSDDHELLAIAEEDIARLREQNLSLSSELSDQEERHVGVIIDLEEAIKEATARSAQLEDLESRIRYMKAELDRAGLKDPSRRLEYEQATVPREASNLSDAALKAKSFLSDRLTIPDDALRDLENLDSTTEATAWGQTAWRGFRALHAYAVDQKAGRGTGSFWQWCAELGNPLVWPATTKKLSMTESRSVETNERLRRARVLPISIDVNSDGELYMPAHLKIATGGGNLAPRIYFHFDPSECKVHVGFFGPHRYMPNTRT